MNRRGFLKLLGVAGAAAAVPIALVPTSRATSSDNVVIGKIQERVFQRIDLMGAPWAVHYSGTVGPTMYDYIQLVDHKPTKRDLQIYRGYAVKAFQRTAQKVANRG